MKINQKLLDAHYSTEQGIRDLIANQVNHSAKRLFEILTEHPHLSYDLFGEASEARTLDELYRLLHSLNHWVVDDGEYSVSKVVWDFMSSFKGEVVYQYHFTSGFYEDSVYVTVEDMLHVAELVLDAMDYLDQNEDKIEKAENWDSNPEYEIWLKKDKAGKSYMKKLWEDGQE